MTTAILWPPVSDSINISYGTLFAKVVNDNTLAYFYLLGYINVIKQCYYQALKIIFIKQVSIGFSPIHSKDWYVNSLLTPCVK